jgi:hypothetical protein
MTNYLSAFSTRPPTPGFTTEQLQGSDLQWYLRVKGQNGEIVARSCFSFTTKDDLTRWEQRTRLAPTRSIQVESARGGGFTWRLDIDFRGAFYSEVLSSSTAARAMGARVSRWYH